MTERLEDLAGKISALAAGADAAAWARAEELRKSQKRVEALESELVKLRGRTDSGLLARVEKLTEELSSVSSRTAPGLSDRVEELSVQLAAFSARLDGAAWGRAEELQKLQQRLETLERRAGKGDSPADK